MYTWNTKSYIKGLTVNVFFSTYFILLKYTEKSNKNQLCLLLASCWAARKTSSKTMAIYTPLHICAHCKYKRMHHIQIWSVVYLELTLGVCTRLDWRLFRLDACIYAQRVQQHTHSQFWLIDKFISSKFWPKPVKLLISSNWPRNEDANAKKKKKIKNTLSPKIIPSNHQYIIRFMHSNNMCFHSRLFISFFLKKPSKRFNVLMRFLCFCTKWRIENKYQIKWKSVQSYINKY